MGASSGPNPAAHKDISDPFFVRGDTPDVPPHPGEDLARLVMTMRRDGRPVWRVGNLAAPRIESRAVPGEDGQPTVVQVPQVDPTPHIHERVWLALDTFHPAAHRVLRRSDRKQLRAMYATLMRDVQGASDDAIADALGAQGWGFSDERAARRSVTAGRALWRQLPAWPWSWFDRDGKPPRDWRTTGPDATLAAAFETWRTGEPRDWRPS